MTEKQMKYVIRFMYILAAIVVVGIFKSDYDAYKKGYTTDYEITINDEDVYICEDYKLANERYTVEGICLDTYEKNVFVFIFENSEKTISSDTVNSFEVKEIKTSKEEAEFKDYVSAAMKGER